MGGPTGGGMTDRYRYLRQPLDEPALMDAWLAKALEPGEVVRGVVRLNKLALLLVVERPVERDADRVSRMGA
jgi:hypothetical protein